MQVAGSEIEGYAIWEVLGVSTESCRIGLRGSLGDICACKVSAGFVLFIKAESCEGRGRQAGVRAIESASRCQGEAGVRAKQAATLATGDSALRKVRRGTLLGCILGYLNLGYLLLPYFLHSQAISLLVFGFLLSGNLSSGFWVSSLRQSLL